MSILTIIAVDLNPKSKAYPDYARDFSIAHDVVAYQARSILTALQPNEGIVTNALAH